MDLGGDLVEGIFLERVNRFLATVEVDGREVGVHVANSGRMKELFVPGWRVLVRPVSGENRKTKFDLVLVDMGAAFASADARMPNALVAEGIANGHLKQFAGYPEIRREVTFGDSRLDLMLEGPQGRCYIEAKSVTLVENGVGLFPDAPTARGAKHLRTLVTVIEAGHRAAVVFVIQRPDANAFATSDPSDPALAEAFRTAVSAGVEAYAYNCQVTERLIRLDQSLPIRPYAEVVGDA
ncbi:MAG: DNA/RNA nuclease SfsA [Chloroflexi bacterium]|nr:DNA/RNA nuclease SfsA [Chloroflexota bacterium]MCH8893078.1 DNA/RNA nuclease SfsA [Chloroflexota bacterium]MCI0788356.1 DNA/RNA nuclease SfsA [Chloroflexota bacterium]MCI0800697.1 DNA/RNA nuclease SfsA [Chloroflexota bacterium]MCI0810465.1 DNA/RNA nuclease SfsA [Chloroflexota bacterium]